MQATVDESDQPEAGNSSNKISRVRRACTKCQERRVKCSGQAPCSRCLEVGAPEGCHITAVAKRATNDRIQELENELRATKEALARNSKLYTAAPESPQRYLKPNSPDALLQEHALFLGYAASGQDQKRSFVWPDEHAAENQQDPPSQRAKADFPLPPEEMPAFYIPDASILLELLGIFVTKIHPIFPVLIWDEFMRRFDQNKPAIQAVTDRVWIATLLTVLAHALQSAPRTLLDANTALSGSQFFADSLQVLGFSHCMAQTSPELIQCLLLMIAFAQTVNVPDLTVSMLALAIQKCQSLGFSPSSRARGPRPLIARMCWSGCISRDFYVSTALGKLPMMTENDVVMDLLPLTSEEDQASHTDGVRPHYLTYFNETIKLHRFAFKALHRLYPFVDGDSYNIALVTELDEGLLQWRQDLPRCWKEDPAYSRENTFIQLRFWFTRHLVHRPSFCHLLARFTSQRPRREVSDFAFNLAVVSAQTAADAALRLLEIVKEVVLNTTAWWINLINIYTACLTLVTALKIDSKDLLEGVRIAPKRAAHAIDEALASLKLFSLSTREHLPAASKTASACEQDIQRISQKMTSNLQQLPQVLDTLQYSNAVPPGPIEGFWPQWQDRGDIWADLFSTVPSAGQSMSQPLNAEDPFDFTSLLLNPSFGESNTGSFHTHGFS